MKEPKCRRAVRSAKDFDICVNIGEKEYVLAEHPAERYTTFYYSAYGSGKFGRIFESDYILLEEGGFYDVTDYVNDKVLFESLEDFYLIGFNTHDKNVRWQGKILKNKKIRSLSVEKPSVIINFNKSPIHIEDKKFIRYDYAYLDPNKNYNLAVQKDYVIGLFWKQ
jgi:hypothetical protein